MSAVYLGAYIYISIVCAWVGACLGGCMSAVYLGAYISIVCAGWVHVCCVFRCIYICCVCLGGACLCLGGCMSAVYLGVYIYIVCAWVGACLGECMSLSGWVHVCCVFRCIYIYCVCRVGACLLCI